MEELDAMPFAKPHAPAANAAPAAKAALAAEAAASGSKRRKVT